MQVIIDIPDDIAKRFQATVPKSMMSSFIADLLCKAIPVSEESLYQQLLAVENDPGVLEIEADWDITVGDGLETR